jgi:hypothetical protein
MDQHEFVARCYINYTELGLETGNPDDGIWQDAHYPAPDPEGDTTIPMLFDDHQQQGLYQSEEWGRCCFFLGDAKKFLTHGPFVPNWFDLWDLYDKWSQLHLAEISVKGSISAHKERNEQGQSLLGVKNGENLSKLHEEKDEFGRSIHALKACEKIHSEKNEFGKSVTGVKAANTTNKIIHLEKNEDGKSVIAVKAGKSTSSQRWMCLKTGHISTPGGLTPYQRSRGINTNLRIRLTD